MKRKIVANVFLIIGVVLALAAVVPVKTLIGQSQPAQASKSLTKTASIGTKGITLRYPENWSVGQPTSSSWVILNVPAAQQNTVKPTVRVLIGYLERVDHADAVSQLAEYANESSQPSTFLVIGGWPALQRAQLVKRPQPGNAPPFADRNMVQITTAVAAGNLLVRLEGQLPSNADEQLKDVVLAIGRSLTFSSIGDPAQVQQEMNKLQGLPKRRDAPQTRVTPRQAAARPSSSAKASASAPIFPPVRLDNLGNNGELEIAVSNDGANIVIAKQSGWVTSSDGGRTFPFSGSLPVSDGDSSLAFGQSGNFYHAALACFGTSCAAVCPPNSTCIEVAASTNNGQTFGALVNAIVCPNSGSGACSVDQEHIAADRVNAGGAGDRVYMGFRNCLGGCGAESDVTCSPDSGATWAPRLPLEGGSDFPRVTVAQDGFMYVVYRNGGNIRIDKFNVCTTSGSQMTRVSGFPKTVSAFTDFAGCETMNGFGGLDRCNDGNILSSPTAAVDDTNANHIYVSWANNTASNNESVLVADSTDGGVNWRPSVTIDTNVTARRFMPWACASGGNAFVTWYDRRAATNANNDLTDYFAASAGLSGGNLVPNNDEFQISTTSDPQCNLWPAAPRSTWDSENCSVQPQNAGRCSVSTNIACDFSGDGTQCPMGETCQTGGGSPKYGDYDGNACVLGRLYTVFSSGVGLSSVRNFFQSFVVTSTPTTLTYTGATTGDYHDTVTLSGVLTLSGTSAGVVAETITFAIGGQNCSGVTDNTGAASCDLTLNQTPGSYTVTATFAGDGLFQASNASAPFTITREETTLTYTGDVIIANNTTAHLSGVLLEDGAVPIAGRTVDFTLGTGGTAQTCSGVTDGTGTAACTISPVNQPFGPGVVTADFAGDAFYLPSSASAATILFAFLDHGSFVVGDETDTGTVEFWGHSWAHDNVLSGGPAPNSFKGFASAISTNPPACADTWTSRTGNSSRPPDTLPSFMGVVVSSSITQSGSTISGDVPKIIVVTPNPGYEPNPGHPGTGTVVAEYCPNPSSLRTARPRPSAHPRPTP